jgi:type IV secretory pathway VirD2 relaxase
LRERASEIVSLDLSPRTDREIEERLTNEVAQEGFTSLDRSRQGAADQAGPLEVAAIGPVGQ